MKNKWKHLRDNFRTELKKTVRGTGNPPQPYQSQWTFFNDLLFLEEQMMKKIGRVYGPFPYKVTSSDSLADYNNYSEDGFNAEEDDNDSKLNGNYLTHSHSVFDDNSLQKEEEQQESISWWLQNDLFGASRTVINANNNCSNNNNNVVHSGAKRKHRLNNTDQVYDDNNCSYSKFKDNHGVGRNHHRHLQDDYHFMMSLLPYVKSLPAPRKMYVRLKLQELFCNFVYKFDSNC